MKNPVTRIYSGRVIDLNMERVDLPNGHSFELEMVRHPGGSAVAAVDGQGRVCLLRQYRHAADGQWLWELPAGKIESGEQPLVTARRELEEEAGVCAGDWSSLGSIFSSPGVFTETIHLYLARQLEYRTQDTEDHEVLETHWVDLPTAVRWALEGTIADGKTVVGLVRASAALD